MRLFSTSKQTGVISSYQKITRYVAKIISHEKQIISSEISILTEKFGRTMLLVFAPMWLHLVKKMLNMLTSI
jgi:hypothetical protein